MKLYEHLNEETILLDIKSREKTEAIAEVAERLRNHASMSDFDAFLGAVYAREMDGTTGIGGGVAIPHARTDSVRSFVAALGLCREGLDFAAVDGRPVKIVILMGIPLAEVKAYLRLLAHLSLLLKQPEFLERLLMGKSAQEVIDALAAHEA
jgi:PTS system fructose-specific IIC component